MAQDAQKFFTDALTYLKKDPITDGVTEPEKFDLYWGLWNMAGQLNTVVRQLNELQQEVDRIKRKVGA